MATKKSSNPSIDRQALQERLQAVQNRVWRARNIAAAIRESLDSRGTFDDPEAALEGLIDYLSYLHLEMDTELLMYGEPLGLIKQDQEAGNV